MGLCLGCGGDDGGGGTSATDGSSSDGSTGTGGSGASSETGAGDTSAGSAGSTGTSGATPPEPTCQAGCTATLAADCQNGPASQDVCEMDCEELLAGMCSSEYQAWLQCGAGGSVTCDSNGLPTVEGCEDEQAVFFACITGG